MPTETHPTQLQPPEIHLIAAARPNFMKIAPVFHRLKTASWARPVLIHTGQHYDPQMSDVFWQELSLPSPDLHLGIGSGTHAEQTAGVMLTYERVCMERPPSWVVVVGDVNATAACALVAKKLCLPLAHLEAGLRSGDRTMPEEINRLVTDTIADLLWTPSADADDNLRREGVASEKIERVGNIMIDSFEMLRRPIAGRRYGRELGLTGQDYAVVTMHRPANVDDPAMLASVGIRSARSAWPRHDYRAAGLYRIYEPGVGSACRHHRFRRRSGGNNLSRYSMLDGARYDRASGHDFRRHQSPGPDPQDRG
jgi:UDP-N-acetylglucosamine 2-epimerase (non-hydrolysing)